MSDVPPNHGEITPPQGFVLATGTDPAEDLIGPFYFRRDAKGQCTGVGFWPQVQHTNGMRSVHGGVLSTSADESLCTLARDVATETHIVTVSLQVDFVASAALGEWLIGTGEAIRRTRSLVFMRGELRSAEDVVVAWHGIGKRVLKS